MTDAPIRTRLATRERWWSIGEWLVIGLAAVWVVLATTERPGGDTLNSRLATVYALSVHGTWVIAGPDLPEPNPFAERTVDKVQVGDSTYSSKPPVLPLLMTGLYQVMRPLVGWDIREPEDIAAIGRVMAVVFSGGGYLLCLLFTRALLHGLVLRPGARFWALFGLAFGTQLTGFALHFNNHVPAAGLAVCAVYLAVGLFEDDLAPKTWRFVVFGLTGALAILMDIPVGAYVGLAGLALVMRFPKQLLLWSVLGALPVVAVHAAVLYWNTGSPLPVQMHHAEFYLGEDSYWRIPRGIDAMNEPKGLYLFHLTIGRAGVFLLFPILLTGLWAIVKALTVRHFPERGYVLAGALATIALIGYYTLSTNNYGGVGYGVRWFIVTMPFLLVMGAMAMQRTRLGVMVFVLAPLMAVSVFSSYQCSTEAWNGKASWTTRLYGPAVVVPSETGSPE